MSIQASLEGDQIRVKFPYDVELLDRIRSIPGRRWDMASKSWIVPKPQWRALRQSFDDIQVPPEQEEALKSLESARWPSIDRVEGFSGVLYPFQAEAVGFLVERKRCLLADEMGLGKTVSSIAALLELRRRGEISRALIFCPKTIIYQWMTEFKRFTGEDAVPIVGDRDQRAESLGQASKSFLNITNYETVLRMGEQLADLQPDVVVLDEAQRIGSYDAKTTRQIRSLFKPPLRWALTGTPMENSLQELHSIMSWIDPGVLGPWFSFQSRYLIYGGFQGKQIVGSRNLDQLHAQISRWMMRRRKSQVLKDLPPVTVNTYYVDLGPRERAVYKALQRDLKEEYELFRLRRELGGEILARLTYLRECCDHLSLVGDVSESSKLTELSRILEDLKDQKVVVFTEWERMLHLIADELTVGHAELYGALGQLERVKAIDRFTTDPACRIFLSTEAGGLGVNLQAASAVVNFELHWNPARLQQRIGRLHRIGQPSTVTCINLVTRGTIEERVQRVIAEKTDVFRKVIDGQFEEPEDGLLRRLLEEEVNGL